MAKKKKSKTAPEEADTADQQPNGEIVRSDAGHLKAAEAPAAQPQPPSLVICRNKCVSRSVPHMRMRDTNKPTDTGAISRRIMDHG